MGMLVKDELNSSPTSLLLSFLDTVGSFGVGVSMVMWAILWEIEDFGEACFCWNLVRKVLFSLWNLSLPRKVRLDQCTCELVDIDT